MKDGRLVVAYDLVLSSQLTKSQFLASSMSRNAQLLLINYPYTKYKFTSVLEVGLECILIVSFVGEALQEIYIYPLWTEQPTQWFDAQQSVEQANKKRNDRLLENLLGTPPYEYSWGEITSIYDQKGGSSGIVVRYQMCT